MKALDTLWTSARSRVRQERARWGRPGAPAWMALQLDDMDAPVPAGATEPLAPSRTAEAWSADLARFVAEYGTIPVRVTAHATSALLPDVVRFAYRLDCLVSVRTCAQGLDTARAEAILGAGATRVEVRVAGATDAVQNAVLGEDVGTARDAFAALLGARARLGGIPAGRPRVLAEWVLNAGGASDLRQIFDEARRAGLDGVRIGVPWTGVEALLADPGVHAALAWARTQRAPFHATSTEVLDRLAGARTGEGEAGEGGAPGLSRRSGRCAVGGLRVTVAVDGGHAACPFHAGATRPTSDDEDATSVRERLVGHVAATRACTRHCLHPEVLPLSP